MQKNWYIVYTRQKCETKVANLFTKNKIENFCPVNYTEIRYFRRMRLVCEPLFPSYVFVHVEKNDLQRLVKFQNVIGLIYWKCKPAIINDEEIETIREFTKVYKNIKIANTQVDASDIVTSIDNSFYSFDTDFASVKSNTTKVNLPSLGLVMIAETERDNVFKRGVTILQNHSYTN